MAHQRRSVIYLVAALTMVQLHVTALLAEETRPILKVDFTLYSTATLENLFYEEPATSPHLPPVRHAVAAESHGRSSVYSYRGPSPLVFYTTGQVASNPDDKVVFAKVELSAAIRQPLLCFFPRPNGAGWDCLLLDDSLETHPASTLRLVNLSAFALSGRIAGHAVTVPSGPSVLDPIKIGRNVSGSLSVNMGQTQFPILGQAQDVPVGTRLLLVVLPPFRSGTVDARVRYVFDMVPEPAPKKKPQP